MKPSDLITALALILFFINTDALKAEWISDITSKEICPHKKGEIAPFISPEMDIKAIHDFFDKTFYKVDANFFEYSECNPLNLSIEFMEAYLVQAYKLRRDSFIKPVKNLEVDAIICSLGPSAMAVRLMALKKSMDLGWEFKKIHVITRSQKEKIAYDELIKTIFSDEIIL